MWWGTRLRQTDHAARSGNGTATRLRYRATPYGLAATTLSQSQSTPTGSSPDTCISHGTVLYDKSRAKLSQKEIWGGEAILKDRRGCDLNAVLCQPCEICSPARRRPSLDGAAQVDRAAQQNTTPEELDLGRRLRLLCVILRSNRSCVCTSVCVSASSNGTSNSGLGTCTCTRLLLPVT